MLLFASGGIIGALATGVLVNPDLGGTGILDYVVKPGEGTVAAFSLSTQMISQLKAVGLTLVWSAVGSAILYKLVDIIVGLRLTSDEERQGLDIVEHGERAYNY